MEDSDAFVEVGEPRATVETFIETFEACEDGGFMPTDPTPEEPTLEATTGATTLFLTVTVPVKLMLGVPMRQCVVPMRQATRMWCVTAVVPGWQWCNRRG